MTKHPRRPLPVRAPSPWRSLTRSLLLVSTWALCGPIGCGGGTTQVVSDPKEAGEWRKRADSWQGRYEDLDRQTGRLLDVLTQATLDLDPMALSDSLQHSRRVPDLVSRLERKLAQARDAREGGDRYRLSLRCGSDKDDGHYSVNLLRKGGRGRGRGNKIKLVDRTYCPSSALLEVSPAQVSAGDYQLQVSFESAPGHPYHFAFSLRHFDASSGRDEVVCAGETGPSGPPSLNNTCDIALRVAPQADLPVAR